MTELQARYDVYQQSAGFARLHPRGIQDPLTVDELVRLSKDLGKGEVATSMIKLYSMNNNSYGSDNSLYSLQEYNSIDPQNSISALVEKVRLQVEEEQDSGAIGLKTAPFFYTVLEPFSFTETTKARIRLNKEYAKLSKEQQRKVNIYLEGYLEKGLTPKEIKEFLSGYVKFLN